MGDGWAVHSGPLGAPNRRVRGPGHPSGVRYRVSPDSFQAPSQCSCATVLCTSHGVPPARDDDPDLI